MKLRYSGSAVGVWWVAPLGVERVRWVAPIVGGTYRDCD